MGLNVSLHSESSSQMVEFINDFNSTFLQYHLTAQQQFFTLQLKRVIEPFSHNSLKVFTSSF